MTFTFIIMDSLYIMRNLLMIFFLMVVFWTNLGNCEGELTTEISTIPNGTTTTPPATTMAEIPSTTIGPNGPIVQLAPSCDEPAPPVDLVSHSPEFAEGEMNPNRTKSTYDCPEGWEFNGNITAVCFFGVWIYCTAPSCDEPAPPDDLVIHSPDFAEGEMYANGTEIMYDCPDGWDFNGHMTAVCLSGVWTYEDAYCTASPCDEPAPPDNLVFYSPDFAEGEMHAHGTEIMYGCPDGWDLNGHMTAVCLYGVWTYEDANCTASPCDEPAPPDDLVSHSRNFAEGEMYANGTEIMYFCPDGWDLNGNMTAVCLYGVWTYEDANCTVQASSCDKPAPPDYLVSHSPDFAEGEIYPNGTEIMYDCPEGWYINGHRTAVCLSGVWTYEDAFCTDSCDKYTQCFYDETRMHSTVSCNYKTAGNTAPPCYGDGSIITCSCINENYQLSSPDDSYLCRPDEWEDGLYDLHCLTASPCDEPAPPDDFVFHSPDFTKGEMYAHGTEIMYDCPDGLDFNGNMTAVCLYGVWTNEDAYCTASPCDEPAPQDHLVFHSPDFTKGEMYAHGTEIMYGCPDGLDLSGHMTAVCLYGVWTHEDAYCTGSCNKHTQCFHHEILMNSTVNCTIEEARGYTQPPCYGHGSTITCSCKSEKYQLSSPDNSYLCRPGKWKEVLHHLHCLTALPCVEPAPPDDFVIHIPNFAKGEMYPNGTEIMYECPDGLDLNGHMTAVCLYGEWTYEDAYCTDSPCKDPAPANVGVIITPRSVEDDGKSGSRVSYSCPNGYILHGSRSAVCLYGRWIVETVPSCSAVCSTSTDCKSEQKSVCDRGTGSCACLPGKTFKNEKCLVERIIRSSLQLEVAYKDDFANKSSCTFLLREQQICTAFEETFTRLDDKCSSWFVSCKVEAIQKSGVNILADVVTRYDEGVAMVTPEDFDTHIQSEAQSGLRLISITSEEESYNACEEGTDICDHENGYCIYHNGTNYECRCNNFTIDRNQCNPAWHGIECDTCDKYTQCFYDEARMHSTVSCNIETANGNTAHPCYGDGSIITCSCKSDKFQLSSPDNSYLCRPDKWEDGLYDLNCSTGELTTDMSTIPIDTTTTTPASPCDEPDPPAYLVCHSPDFAKRERNANGTVIMNKCPDGFFFKDHRTAVCLYGKWTNEDANCIDWCKIILVIIIAIFTLLYAAQLIWLVKKHYLRRGTKWIPSVEGVANEQVPRTANDESKFVSKVDFEMSDPNGYQNDVNKEDNDACDHVGDNIRGDLPNNDPEEETV